MNITILLHTDIYYTIDSKIKTNRTTEIHVKAVLERNIILLLQNLFYNSFFIHIYHKDIDFTMMYDFFIIIIIIINNNLGQ